MITELYNNIFYSFWTFIGTWMLFMPAAALIAAALTRK